MIQWTSIGLTCLLPWQPEEYGFGRRKRTNFDCLGAQERLGVDGLHRTYEAVFSIPITSQARSVRGLFPIRVNRNIGPTSRELHFGMGIVLGTILIWFPVFHLIVLGCFRNGSGECLYLWAQEKFIYFKQSTQNAELDPAEFQGQFLMTLPSFSSETCVMYSSAIPGTDMLCDWLFLGFSCVSLETTAVFRLYLSVAISWGEKCSRVVETELICIFQINLKKNTKMGFKKTENWQATIFTVYW